MEGITFLIRNEYGKQLYEILEGNVDPSWYWSLKPEEAYFKGPGPSGFSDHPFILKSDNIMDGQTFMNHISKKDYILIFADIKAFPTLESVEEINNETEFINSFCKLGLMVYDSAHVIVYSREKQIIQDIHKRAEYMEYKDIRFLSEEDIIRAVWGWMPRNWK